MVYVCFMFFLFLFCLSSFFSIFMYLFIYFLFFKKILVFLICSIMKRIFKKNCIYFLLDAGPPVFPKDFFNRNGTSRGPPQRLPCHALPCPALPLPCLSPAPQGTGSDWKNLPGTAQFLSTQTDTMFAFIYKMTWNDFTEIWLNSLVLMKRT